jgi:hypothetical protein
LVGAALCRTEAHLVPFSHRASFLVFGCAQL